MGTPSCEATLHFFLPPNWRSIIKGMSFHLRPHNFFSKRPLVSKCRETNKYNTELNDLRKIICWRKSKVTGERISVCNVTEKLIKHGINCLPCSFTNDVIDLLP